MQSFRIETADFSISVASHSVGALELVHRHLLPWLPRVRGPQGGADINIVVGVAPPGDRFTVEVNGGLLTASETMPNLFTVIQQAADAAMIRRLNRETALHAGCIVYRGRAIVMPGGSGSGKSSLVLELLRQGAEYCSDEYAIVDRQGFVVPYPRALMIRGGDQQQHPVLASAVQAKVCERQAPVSLFMFLRYEPGADGLDVRPLDRSQSLMLLLQNTPQVMAENLSVLDPLKAAVSSAVSYEGVRGEASGVAAEILHLAASVG